MHQAITVRVPAKVNLQLAVGAPRPDGFHDIATVFHAVSLYDDVTACASEDEQIRVTVEGAQAAAVPTGEENLVVRAARLLAARVGVPAAVDLHVHKTIPVAGGMAGGSADAAGALLACDALWGTGMARHDLLELAAELGSDVPFGLVGGTAIGLGRGERLMPALARGRFEWVFALANGPLPTPSVYAECDRLRAGRVLPKPRISDDMMTALRAGNPEAVGNALRNDLQPAACSLRPALRMTLQVGRDYGALGGIVSGSGPTVAFLVRDHEHGLDLAVALTASGVCEVVKRAYGPVHGARAVEPGVAS